MAADLTIQRVASAERHRVFAFIRQQFAQHFGADIVDDTPELFAVMDSDGEIQAAFGLNRNPHTFFCRHYIGDVNCAVDANYPRWGGQTARRTIELSHLCIKKPATLCRLITPLAQFLSRQAEYLVCTVTQKIADLFERKGLTSHRVGHASILSINRSSYRHQSQRGQVDAVHQEVVRLSEQYSYWGYRKIYDLIDRDQFPVGRERVRLIRRREGLQVVQKAKKKKVLGGSTQWVHRAEHPNHVWSYDFVSDRVTDGRTLKCLTVVDEFTRQGMTIHCGTSVTSTDVIAVLAELALRHGRPKCIRSDNGPEFIATAVKNWLAEHTIGTHYIDPGSPWQNAYGESFNSIFRTTCLNRWMFESVSEARSVVMQWLAEYNTIRPHGSLGGRSPAQFIEDWSDDRREEASTEIQKQRPLT